MEKAIEQAKAQNHLKDGQRPMLLSDNGAGFTSKILAGYPGKPWYQAHLWQALSSPDPG
jgi:hypothetical protein